MDKWGGALSLLGVLAAENKGIAFGVSATISSHFSLGLRGHRFGGHFAFGTFCMIPIFLLKVADTRLLTIAHVEQAPLCPTRPCKDALTRGRSSLTVSCKKARPQQVRTRMRSGLALVAHQHLVGARLGMFLNLLPRDKACPKYALTTSRGLRRTLG